MKKIIITTIVLALLFSTPCSAELYMDDSEAYNYGFKNSGIDGYVYFISPPEKMAWVAQVVCADILDDARAIKRDLIAMGYEDTAIQLSRNSVGDLFYPVITGLYNSKQQATSVVEQIKDIYKKTSVRIYQLCYFERVDGTVVFTHPYRERPALNDLTGHFVN
jgi:hypothetical protein